MAVFFDMSSVRRENGILMIPNSFGYWRILISIVDVETKVSFSFGFLSQQCAQDFLLVETS